MNVLLLYLGTFLIAVSARPQIESLVTTIQSSTARSDKQNGDSQHTVPKIYKMFVSSKVTNRFATTVITSNVKNLDRSPQEATFAVVLPENAYISDFIMEINNKNYTAYVQAKEPAKATYDQAVYSGLGAAHVAVSARDSNRFTVSVNIEPASNATFYLTYEELLKRKNGYEIVINIHPNQPVPHLEVQVDINESSPIKYVKAPAIRSGNDIRKSEADLDPRASINKINETFTTVTFKPDEERQKQLAHALGTKENDGLAGQFVVQYDVKRVAGGGEILLKDGYFVHFFSPDELTLLPKYVLFVLDTSDSMHDEKIAQLKQAMISILSELKPGDLFSIIEFSTRVKVWNVVNETHLMYPEISREWQHDWDNNTYDGIEFPEGFAATPENIAKAKNVVNTFHANGGTNIFAALKIALHLYDLRKANSKQFNKQPIIVFLTDGDPSVGESDTSIIISKISEGNVHSIPIFTLSFGWAADKNFLRKLSLRNSAFSRHIYEASDATLQLENFYKQISSPLLKNIEFKYTKNVKNLTRTTYPLFFRGDEYVVSGHSEEMFFIEQPFIMCWEENNPIILTPEIKKTFGELERLWAYLTVQQLLEAKEVAKNTTEYEIRALDLAVSYAFVTPISSLVVVKPDDTSAVEIVAADIKTEDSNGSLSLSVGSYAYENALEEHTYTHLASDPPVGSTTSKLNQLVKQLPWLSTILSGDIITLKGVQYKLGIAETINETTQCLNAPNNATGHCKLLYNCESVTKNNVLTTVDVYAKYFCHIAEYAGICCPIVP